ncbi:Uncharacterized conserved protein, DUF427 family [Parafrankia irregularis]|uniref:Uncharacterized conserved protein, DUF427 family n=1 Tax=Parafrankia irregularis TaxID=795642 RepID=A0A0S4R0Y4_9ACTN|nr:MULTISPECIES: DUF427 domain-containing protein [Parafrankia]MBE3200440.1 DUF427 domain-containing protein [Parafrankia sp. CH37]CUU60696.1 Uncharacterized conserved protein, DUF427 family [Parafrankia irregularis]
MSLTAAQGPLGPTPAGRFSAPVPAGVVYVEPHPRRVQAVRDGQKVIDTEAAVLVHRSMRPLAYAFPLDVVGTLPCEPLPEAPGYFTIPWDAVDEWWEEGRRLVHYPANPYHRVDCRPTTRRLRVEAAGEVLVDTSDTVILFETSLNARLYVDPAHVRTDLLRRSGTTSYCNYKGHATWWTAVVNDTVIADVAWSYDEPLPESLQVGGFLSFDPEVCTVTAELPAGSVMPENMCDGSCAVPVRVG